MKPAEGAGEPLYPFPRDAACRCDGMRIRDVLDLCQRFREACIEAGRIVDLEGILESGRAGEVRPEPPADKASKEKLEQAWNDFFVQYQEEPPESDQEIVKLFGWAVQNCAEGVEGGYRFDVTVKGEALEINVMVPVANGEHRLGEEIFVALCNRAPQGNGLRTQLEAARKQAKPRILAILRCDEFPKDRRTAVWKTVEDIVQKGGRKAVLEQSDLRKVAAFRRFRGEHGQHPHLQEWLREGRHLSKILSIIHILELEDLQRFDKGVARRVAGPSPAPAPAREGG